MKIALLCAGLGNIARGHEVFARDLFTLLGDSVDITLFKGGGAPAEREFVIANISRNDPALQAVRMPTASPKWEQVAIEQERLRIEAETFTHAALQPLLEGGYDIIHCLEREVCERLYGLRHLFANPPKILFSNGGAIPAADLPPCDAVQEHTPYNLQRSARAKAFMIPHGVDTERFHPEVPTEFRARHGIPADAFVVISVGTICFWHKRMDHVIREMATLPEVWLVIVGQESPDTPAIKALGEQLMPGRIVFTKLPHAELPTAYAAADVFVLGSLFEAFGIVYVEAMAMGLPVISTEHPNQRGIVQEGLFVDMARPGALSAALRAQSREQLRALGERGRQVALRDYDVRRLRERYLAAYRELAARQALLPRWTLSSRLAAHARGLLKQLRRQWVR